MIQNLDVIPLDCALEGRGEEQDVVSLGSEASLRRLGLLDGRGGG